jgi:thiamine-phosphate pyrophosphorylase
MSETEQPQIYLITPTQFELSSFSNDLSGLLDTFEIACVRLRCASEAAEDIGRDADNLREVCHAREVPLVVENHGKIALTHGLDGVHLTDGARQLRYIREMLEDDAIVGTFCENSRHYGLTAGEAGADYVSFGPMGETPLSTSEPADLDTFTWWSEVVEVPVVAEGAISLEMVEKLAPITDFIALGPEVFSTADAPEKALSAYVERIR